MSIQIMIGSSLVNVTIIGRNYNKQDNKKTKIGGKIDRNAVRTARK